MVRLEVVGVRVDRPHNAPVLLLRDSGGDVHLPIWIAATEASAIVAALEGEEPERPMTHDLVVSILAQLDRVVTEVKITDVVEGIFLGEIVLGETTVSARPSDAIAIAVRCGAPILCEQAVLDAVGVSLTSPDDEMKRFREFLEHVNPEDFGA